jgi:hypothetical protein
MCFTVPYEFLADSNSDTSLMQQTATVGYAGGVKTAYSVLR